MTLEKYQLKTERFDLRALVPDDLSALTEKLCSDPEVVKTLLGDVSTPEKQRELALLWIDPPGLWEKQGYGSWGVFDRNGAFGSAGELIGVTAASKGKEGSEGPEIFYFFSPKTWRYGVASEAVRVLCDHLIFECEQAALEAFIFSDLNPGSVRVAEKLGMRFVARVPMLGHHLEEDRLRETIAFDVWRLAHAPIDRAQTTLDEVAFRCGQFLAEIGEDPAATTSEICSAAKKAGLEQILGGQALYDRVNSRLAAGTKAPGLALYRVRRRDFEPLRQQE
jgi:RimJ/RimL family protein N-acetyltransferase